LLGDPVGGLVGAVGVGPGVVGVLVGASVSIQGALSQHQASVPAHELWHVVLAQEYPMIPDVPCALPDVGVHVVPLSPPGHTVIATFISGGFMTVIGGQSVVGALVGALLVGPTDGAVLGVRVGPALGATVRKQGSGGLQLEGPPEIDIVQVECTHT